MTYRDAAAQTDLTWLGNHDILHCVHCSHIATASCPERDDSRSLATIVNAYNIIPPELGKSLRRSRLPSSLRRRRSSPFKKRFWTPKSSGDDHDSSNQAVPKERSPFKRPPLIPLPVVSSKATRDGAYMEQEDVFLPRGRSLGRKVLNYKTLGKRIGSDTLRIRDDFVLAQEMSRTSPVHDSPRALTVRCDSRPGITSLKNSFGASLSQHNNPMQMSEIHADPLNSRTCPTAQSGSINDWLENVVNGAANAESQGRLLLSSTSSTRTRPLAESLDVFGVALPHTLALMDHLQSDTGRDHVPGLGRSKHIAAPGRPVFFEDPTVTTDKIPGQNSLPNAISTNKTNLTRLFTERKYDTLGAMNSRASILRSAPDLRFENLMNKLASRRSNGSSKVSSLNRHVVPKTSFLREADKENLPECPGTDCEPELRPLAGRGRDASRRIFTDVIRRSPSDAIDDSSSRPADTDVKLWLRTYRGRPISKVQIPACFTVN